MTGLLIGRDAERAQLRAWLEDPEVQIIVVRGPAGSGKTALVQSVLTDAVLTGSLVGAAKYAEGGGDNAFGPIMRALSELVGAALDQLYDPSAGLTSLVDTIGGLLPVLSGAGFKAEGAAIPRPVGERSSRAQAAARVTMATVELLRWLRGFNLPAVLFIDDWRRASAEARASLRALIDAPTGLPLTLVLNERDELPLDDVAREAFTRVLPLGGLSAANRTTLFGRFFGGEEAGRAVEAWFEGAGPALPLDIIETARELADSGAVTQVDPGVWRVDAARTGPSERPEVQASLSRRIDTLPSDARRLAVGAALWGDTAPAEALARASGLSAQAFEHAVNALARAGLVKHSDREVRFNHDRFRTAMSSALDARATAELAEAMSTRLLDWVEPTDAPLSMAALNLRSAAGLETASPALWRNRFAEGAHAARESADPASASTFAEAAWTLNEREPVEAGPARNLIFREAILAAADRKDGDAVKARVDQMLALADSPAALGQAYTLGMLAYRLLADAEVAWTFAQQALERFGLKLQEPTPAALGLALARWRLGRELPSALRRSKMRPEWVDPFTQVANAAGVMAYERNPSMAALIALQASAKLGRYTEGSPFWCSTDAFIMAMMGDMAAAGRLGQVAVAQMDSGVDRQAVSLYRALYFGVVWIRKQGSVRHRCREIRDMALADGELLAAATAIRNWAMLGWRCSPSLDVLRDEVEEAWREARLLGDPEVNIGLNHLRVTIDLVRNPAGRAVAAEQARRIAAGEPLALQHRVHGLLELELLALWGEWETLVRVGTDLRPMLRSFDNHPGGAVWRFLLALAHLKTGRPASRRDVAFVRKAAGLNPDDHRHKVLLLRAEALRRKGAGAACLSTYALAVEAAGAGDSRLEAGVAAECAAQAAEAFGRSELAARYTERARAIWVAWGARAKLGAPALAAQAEGKPAPPSAEVDEARALAISADRANRAKSRLLADVAHELRTPLQGMQGLLDLAAEDGRQLDTRALSSVLASLKTVVDDLSEYGALSSGGATLALQPVDLAELVRSEAALAGSLPGRRCTGVKVEMDELSPPLIDTDGSRVRQVLRNLLSNALKYGAGQVRVHVGTEPAEEPGVLAFTLSVTDEGEGIPESELIRLFEPFERGERRDRGGDPGGLGLGLAVSRQVAERLGGSLGAHNRPEGGACFRFTFQARPSQTAAPEVAPLKPLRVLVCDDVPLIRQVLVGLLRMDGHEVAEAADGLEAVSAMAEAAYDLAIVDLTMPGLNGLEVLRSVRDRSGPHPPPVFVLLTASAREGVGAEAEAAGAAMMLRKPVSAADLRGALRRLFADVLTTSDGAESDPGIADTFRSEAALELARQVAQLVDRSPPLATAADAHRAAGLAAQFGWPELAEACERLESELAAGRPSDATVESLRTAWNAAFAEAPLARGKSAALLH